MIELDLIPDGMTELPSEAMDHSALWTHLQNAAGNVSEESALSEMNEIERESHRGRLTLRMPGSLSDNTQQSRDAIVSAIVNNINGVKKHPDGWRDVSGGDS